MPDIELPLNATAAEIAKAIRAVQLRSKKGLCPDPDALAARVRAQLADGEAMSRALGLELVDLSPTLQAWGNKRDLYDGGDSTLIRVSGHSSMYGTPAKASIVVTRSPPFSSASNGVLTVHLKVDEEGKDA